MSEPERRLAAILSADVVGYSRLMAEDEDATVRTLQAYREEIELLLRQHGKAYTTILYLMPTAHIVAWQSHLPEAQNPECESL